MVKPRHSKQVVDDGLAGKSIEELLLLIGDRDLGYAMSAMDTVVAMGLDAVYPVLERGVRDDDNADLRNGAMEVLVRFGRASVPALIVLLQDANGEVRNFSAVMLGDIGDRGAVKPLIQALGDPDINVSHAAAEALGKIGDDAALLPLMGVLHGDIWLQYPAVVAMGAMADSRAVPSLIPLLDNELLLEPVIAALGKIGDRRALPALMAILCDCRRKSVAATAEAVVAIVEKQGGDTKAELVSAIDNQGIKNLLGLLSGSNAGERGAAMTLLGLVGEKAVIPALLTLLEEDNNEEVVKEAIVGIFSSSPLLGEKILLSNTRKIQVLVLSLLRNLNFQGQVLPDCTELSRR
ncbi:HEAT repeat domain-containing protein [Geotalea sp. SG265]|uniref:HEAT repeat domain-containing protein n=1 Tax=Geotalea sp. SG265 TaxID=2922867 RepID=UPI001FAFD890|nr:HEAT repeat domain-containing protein [Geotalea sp. SG265]